MGFFYFNVSIHDISPARENEARTLLHLCEECGIRRGALLVVPDFHGQDPLNPRSSLVLWLQKLSTSGWEIALHGYEHRMPEPARLTFWQRLIAHHYTDHEGEFFLLSENEARSRILRGLSVLHECGLQPAGFIAPAWLMSRETISVLEQLPFSFTTTLSSVYDLAAGRRRFAPVQAFSSRSTRRVLGSAVSGLMAGFCWEKLSLVRVALHPSDLDSPLIIRTARQLLQHLASRRTCILLEEYTNLISSRNLLREREETCGYVT